MNDDPIRQAVELLLHGRQKAQLELQRIDAALTSLGHLSPGPELGALYEAALMTPASPPSIRSVVVSLLDEEAKDWSAPEVLAELESRKVELRSKDPANAVRAALAEANKNGEAFRTGYGKYMSTRYQEGQMAAVFKNEPGTPEEGAAAP